MILETAFESHPVRGKDSTVLFERPFSVGLFDGTFEGRVNVRSSAKDKETFVYSASKFFLQPNTLVPRVQIIGEEKETR